MLAFSILFALCASAAAFGAYTPETYPDSLRQPIPCNVPEPGFLCDPNGILKTENGTQLRLMKTLVASQNRTQCVCGSATSNIGACDEDGLGFIFSIALTEKMVLNDDERERDTVLQAAAVFADMVRKRWNRGHCQDDLLIFLSQNDRVVWTSVGDTTKLYLSPEMITSVSTHAEETYFKKDKFYDGLNYMVDAYTRILAGEKFEVTSNRGWYWPLPLWAVITIFVVVGLIILAVIGVGIYFCAKHFCCHDGRGRYSMTSRM